jgi:hypothetical protein
VPTKLVEKLRFKPFILNGLAGLCEVAGDEDEMWNESLLTPLADMIEQLFEQLVFAVVVLAGVEV